MAKDKYKILLDQQTFNKGSKSWHIKFNQRWSFPPWNYKTQGKSYHKLKQTEPDVQIVMLELLNTDYKITMLIYLKE